MKPVLILTAAFGEGHNAAARNLQAGLLSQNSDVQAPIHDVFQEAYGVWNDISKKVYLAAINHTPQLWAACFRLLDETPLVPWHIGIYQAAARRLDALLSELRPGVIVSTYPGCNHLLDHVCRKRLRRAFQTITVITDSITVNTAWHTAHADALVVPNDATAQVLLRHGFPADKVHAFGFPVPGIFEDLARIPKHPPATGEPWKILYMVNSGGHLAADIVRSLLGIDQVAVTVTVGKNEALGERLKALAEETGKPLRVLGWTPDMPRLMAESHLLIGKAGGATVQECLAAGTPMIFTQVVPGQEEGNARLVLENGAGFLGKSAAEIVCCIQEIFRDHGRQWERMTSSARALGNPGASATLAHFILTQNL
ncbi:MAG: glycosyltransferase [Terrimicrobiaceae bacterium]